MGTVIVETTGWFVSGGTVGEVFAYPVTRWPGPAPKVGQRPPTAGQLWEVKAVVTNGVAMLELQEDTAYYLGELFGRRWVHMRTDFADAAAEQERAEAAEAAIQLEIEELREATESG